jgi:hypothetical protein
LKQLMILDECIQNCLGSMVMLVNKGLIWSFVYCYAMTFDSLSKYNEDSIFCTHEILTFLRRKFQMDIEYSKAIGRTTIRLCIFPIILIFSMLIQYKDHRNPIYTRWMTVIWIMIQHGHICRSVTSLWSWGKDPCFQRANLYHY